MEWLGGHSEVASEHSEVASDHSEVVTQATNFFGPPPIFPFLKVVK